MTYDWSMYCTLVDSLMGKLVSDLKTQAIKKKMASAPQYRSESESEEEIKPQNPKTPKPHSVV